MANYNNYAWEESVNKTLDYKQFDEEWRKIMKSEDDMAERSKTDWYGWVTSRLPLLSDQAIAYINEHHDEFGDWILEAISLRVMALTILEDK